MGRVISKTMWLRAISLWLLIAVIYAHEHNKHSEHEHEHGHEHEHEHEHCSVKHLQVVVMKSNNESCSEDFSIDMSEDDRQTACGDVDISCGKGMLSLARVSIEDIQYVMPGCLEATVTFDKDQDCTTCMTVIPNLD